MAGRSKALDYGCSLTGNAGSNPAGARTSVSCKWCALSGGGLCDGSIIRPEKSYRVECVSKNLNDGET